MVGNEAMVGISLSFRAACRWRSLVVLAFGLLIAAVVTWTSSVLNDRNEIRLHKLQTDQAGTVLLGAAPSTQTPQAFATRGGNGDQRQRTPAQPADQVGSVTSSIQFR